MCGKGYIVNDYYEDPMVYTIECEFHGPIEIILSVNVGYVSKCPLCQACEEKEEMPTYIYDCEKCGNIEVSQSIKEDALETCPLCEANGVPDQKVKRLIAGGTGFTLQGTGWAKDRYS